MCISPSFTCDFFLDILDINSSMFGICAFRLIVASFNFLESIAILIDLSFFTVSTAGLTKQSSLISVARSKNIRFLSISSFLWLLDLVGVLVLVFLFVV